MGNVREGNAKASAGKGVSWEVHAQYHSRGAHGHRPKEKY
jgi:hypothetical protein